MGKWPLRLARLIAIAVIVAVGINSVVWAIADWHLADMRVYQEAALRIRAGEPIYGGVDDTLSAYRYAPWFAYAWVPITHLPQTVINVGWSAFLLAGSALALWSIRRPLTRSRVALLLLMAPILFGISAIGNVHGPMMAVLFLGIPRRWGGLAVGIAASLKVVPILLVLIFVAQRRWTQVAVGVLVAGVLWLPAVWMEWSAVTTDPGGAQVLPLPIWLAVAAGAIALSVAAAIRRSRYAGLAAATAAALALPRLFVYEISLVMVGALDTEQRRPERTDERSGRPTP